MLGTIQKIKELYSLLIDKNKEADVVKTDLDIRAEKLKEEGIALDSRTSNISAREVEVKKIEDIVDFSVKVGEDKKKVDIERGELDIEKTAFETYQAQEKDTHAKLKASLESSIKAADEKEAKFTEELAKLEERKKNLSVEIVEELTKKK